jgi:hypothetical protein
MTGSGHRAGSSRRRLAIYLDNFSGGGVHRTTLLLAGALAARGHEVELLVCRRTGALLDQVPGGVEVIELGRPSWLTARALALKGGLPISAVWWHCAERSLRRPSLSRPIGCGAGEQRRTLYAAASTAMN